MRVVAFVLAILIAISLVGCQNQGQPESVPPSGSEGGVILESQGSAETPEEPGPVELEAAPGVEICFLASFSYPQFDIWSGNHYIWDGHLLAELSDKHRAGGWDLLCFDLETGEQVFSMPMDEYRDTRYLLRQVFDQPGGFLVCGPEGLREYNMKGELLSEYSLPEIARIGEGYPYNNYFRQLGGSRWDVLPERDLLAWCGPEGLWVADVNGENPRLVLATEAIGQQPEFPLFAQTVEDLQDLEPGEQVGFQSVRFMDEGRVLSADFGSPQMQTGVLGHVLVSLEDDRVSWYQPYFVGAPSSASLEYLDDTTLLAGTTRIDAVTGETSRAARGELDDFYAITGDFQHYYGAQKTDTAHQLLSYDTEDRETIELLLTLPSQPETAATDDITYTRFYPMAVEGNKVVCYYQLPKEEGLMLVTVPEE